MTGAGGRGQGNIEEAAMSSSGPGALKLYRHEVTLRFLEKAVVPPYEGSMIRGAFGRAFKESCCPFPHGNGAGCSLGDRCPYGYVFETSPPEDAREFAKNREVPRPYIFEPPQGTKMEYAPGEKMRFGFTVVGRAAEYMPYFIFAFSKMGEEGIGRLRARHRSETLEGVVGRVEYAGPVEEFLPLLHIGQLTHAGKRAVFGLGRYRLLEG
jgi:hypothetical protein